MTSIIQQGDFISKDGRYWLTTEQLGKHLGYNQNSVGVHKILSRNREELLPFTCTTKMVVQGQSRDVRLFDEQGCYIVAMLAKTPAAKQFRRALARFLQQVRQEHAALGDVHAEYTRLRITNARLHLEQLAATKRWSKHSLQRVVQLRESGLLSSTEISKLFNVRAQEVRLVYKLHRETTGDFRDLRPQNLLKGKVKAKRGADDESSS